jgi:hypothetical protein
VSGRLEKEVRRLFGIEFTGIPSLEDFGIDGKGAMNNLIAELSVEDLEGLGKCHPMHMIAALARRAAAAIRERDEARAELQRLKDEAA